MSDYPKEMTVREILHWAGEPPMTQHGMRDEHGNQYWIPARSLPYWPSLPKRIRHRFRCAWLVFTGRADVLHWR